MAMLWTSRLDPVRGVDGVIDFVREVAGDLRTALSDWLVAVYIHGSAALGDFDPLVSDIDLLVVLEDNAPTNAVRSTGDVLHAPRSCPALGIEASAVSTTAARRPRQPWPFLVHVCTAVNDDKVVLGRERDGDDDLILHYAVIRAVGIAIDGPPAQEVIGDIDAATILQQLGKELIWATRNASGPYAVLNACRALRYRADLTVCSKTDGGVWALEHGIAPEVVRPALAARRASTTYPLDPASEAWVLAIAQQLGRPR
jgi:streptomycin 3"-adenylyltransferase